MFANPSKLSNFENDKICELSVEDLNAMHKIINLNRKLEKLEKIEKIQSNLT